MAATLNTVDLPEAGITYSYQQRSCGRPTHARRGVRRTGAKVAANAGLLFVPECSELVAFDLAEIGCSTSSEAELQWQCSACTFLNASAMPSCEVCGTPKQQRSTCIQITTAIEQMPPHEQDVASWPSLAEAVDKSFAFCEVSSVGSSWLEIGETGEDLIDDETCSVTSFLVLDDASALSQSKSSPPPTASSWAARLAQTPGLVGPRRPPMRMPPLIGKTQEQREADVIRKFEAHFADEMADGDLDELQVRRQHAAPRGKTQILRHGCPSMRRCR